MHPNSEALHIMTELAGALPAATPIFQVSAFDAASPYFYTRKSNPNIEELERVVCHLESAKYGVAATTGMAAIALTLELLRPRDVLVVSSLIYGCSFKALQRVSERRELRLVVLDLTDRAQWDAIPATASMVFLETPTNPFLRTIDISALAGHLAAIGCHAKLVVDNTWATPLYQKPLQRGAHISLHSGTKYFSGHSDVMGGIVLTDDPSLQRELLQCRFYTGMILPPFSAWLMRRSLQTLKLRLVHQSDTTKRMRDYLTTVKQIKTVYYPEIDGTQLTDYGGILFFQLADACLGAYEEFRDSLRLFKTGTGMACVTSMVAQPYTGSHASMDEREKAEIGLDRGLVRLCFGLEEIEDIRADLAQAFARLEPRVVTAGNGHSVTTQLKR